MDKPDLTTPPSKALADAAIHKLIADLGCTYLVGNAFFELAQESDAMSPNERIEQLQRAKNFIDTEILQIRKVARKRT